MLQALDIFFVVFHTTLILFNLFGWIWKKTRKLNLVVLLITLFSWTVLGIFYGFGYCFLTDWHWDILEKRGEADLPASYIRYLLDRLLGIELGEHTVDLITGIGFFTALTMSGILNYLDRKKSRENLI